MEIVTPRRSARKLFPDSPIRHHRYLSESDGDAVSDADTIGPMSPLSSPSKAARFSSPMKELQLFNSIIRKSPRISRVTAEKSEVTVIAAESPMSVDETPAKSVSATDLTTPFRDPQHPSEAKRVVVVEESPDIFAETPENKKPPSKVPASSRDKKCFSPSSGITCSSFYSKPKARHALFADFISHITASTNGRKRMRSASVDKKLSVKPSGHFKRPKNEPYLAGKNARHGIKKPKPKTTSKQSLNLTPAKKMPLICPKDRVQTFLDTAELDDLIADINHPENRSKILVDDDDDDEMELVLELEVDEPLTVASPKKLAKILPVKVESPKADPKKKFFKTNRTMEINRTATVTVDKNIKIQVSNGKFSLQKAVAKAGKNPLKTRQCPSRFHFARTETQVQKKVQDILEDLDDKVSPAAEDIAENALMSPGQNMSAITSSTSLMALGDDVETASPGGSAANGSVGGASENESNGSVTKEALFPLFYKGKTTTAPNCPSVGGAGRRATKRPFRSLGEAQYQLDAGQRRWGATQCAGCGLVYQMGEPDDENDHHEYHENFAQLKYTAWKAERVVAEFEGGRVVAVYPGDHKSWWNKVSAVLDVVDRELGFVDTDLHDLGQSKVFMYVSGSRVVGCLLSQPVQTAYKMLSDITDVDCCSEECYPVKAGISRLWTAQDWRRKKVASRLVDAMRSNSVVGSILQEGEFAFSVPTITGKEFARQYTKCPNYLVYM